MSSGWSIHDLVLTLFTEEEIDTLPYSDDKINDFCKRRHRDLRGETTALTQVRCYFPSSNNLLSAAWSEGERHTTISIKPSVARRRDS